MNEWMKKWMNQWVKEKKKWRKEGCPTAIQNSIEKWTEKSFFSGPCLPDLADWHNMCTNTHKPLRMVRWLFAFVLCLRVRWTWMETVNERMEKTNVGNRSSLFEPVVPCFHAKIFSHTSFPRHNSIKFYTGWYILTQNWEFSRWEIKCIKMHRRRKKLRLIQ